MQTRWKGGRPNIDEILIIKMLVLQQWHGLSDPELERQANDRILFRKFLGYPEKIPDRSIIWLFRERLSESGKDTQVWDELQRQLDMKSLKIRKGMIQDATFIHSDPGHATADTPRGKEGKTRRSKDGTWTKKGGARDHPIGIMDILRNGRISRKRSRGERPFAMIKSVFMSGKAKATDLNRVRVKNMFSAFCFNLYQMRTINKQRS